MYVIHLEPERKRLATSPVALAAAQAAAVAARVAAAAAAGIQGIGGPGSQFGNVINEEIKVPDKMVGLSKYKIHIYIFNLLLANLVYYVR